MDEKQQGKVASRSCLFQSSLEANANAACFFFGFFNSLLAEAPHKAQVAVER